MSYVFGNIVIDNSISGAGTSSRAPVLVATTGAQTLATDFENGDVIDGVTLTTGDRVLIKDQSAGSENGIYIVNATGAPSRASDFDEGDAVSGVSVTVLEGTVNDDTLWLCTNDDPNDIVGTDALVFIKSGGVGANGDMSGPASSTANTVPRYADTTGKSLTTSGISIDASNNLSGVASVVLNAGGNPITISATSQTTAPSTLNIPNLAGTGGDITITNASQTLINKTLTAPVIATISNTGTLTLPTTTDTLVGRATTDTLTNKTLTLPVISSISNGGTLTLPSGTDTLVARATSDTLTNKTMNANNNNFSNFLHGTQVDNPSSGVHGVTGSVVGTSDSQTLTNKTLTSPVISTIVNTGTLTLPTSTDTLVGRDTTDTLTNKTLTSPQIGTSIQDTNGNELLLLAPIGSAVNQMTVVNAATGTDPSLIASGDDADIGIILQSKGTGTVRIASQDAAVPGELHILDATGGQYSGIRPSSTLSGSYILQLPADTGVSGQFLRTDGNNPASLVWALPGGGGGGDVLGPGSATDNAVVRFYGASGTSIQNSSHTIGDNGEYTMSGTSAYIQLPDISAPANPGAGLGRLYKKTGSSGLFWKPDAGGAEVDLTTQDSNTQYKRSVRVATNANGALNTAYENGDVIDGVTMSTGDRILIKNQTTGSENGIYIVNATGAPTRASDLPASASASMTVVFVEQGNIGNHTGWVCTNTTGSDVVGTNALNFEKFTGQFINSTITEVSDKTGSFVSIKQFMYPGNNYIGRPSRVWAITREDNGVTTEVRVQDITNAVTIAIGTTTQSATSHATELTVTQGNIPSDLAIWEVQFRRLSGSGNNNAYCSGVSLLLGG